MMASMTATKTPVVQLYEETKAELKAMEYYEFLGMESLDLVRILLSDLVMTTESHEKQQKKIEILERDLGTAQESGFTLRRENARLVRENNQLHIDMIRRAEELDERERELQGKLQDANDRIAEANYKSSQFESKLQQSERALAIARGNSGEPGTPRGDLTVSNFDGGVANNTVLNVKSTSAFQHDKENNANNGNNVSVLEKRLQGVSEEAKELREKLAHVSKQVELRDAEVIRLGKELERRDYAPGSATHAENPASERPEPERQLQQSRHADEKVIAQLYDQIDFLNAQLQDKESKMQKANMDSKLLEQARIELQRKDAELKKTMERLGDAVSAQAKSQEEKDVAIKASQEAAQNAEAFLMSPERLENALSNAKSNELATLLEAYREDKSRFAATVQRLEQLATDHRMRAEQLEQELHDRVSQQVKAEESSKKAEAERQRLEGELGDAQRALAKLHDARLSAEETSAAMTGEVGSLESLVEDQRADLGALRGELERIRTAEQETISQLEQARADLARVERERDSLQDRLRHSILNTESLHDERDALQRYVDSVLNDLKKEKVLAQDMKAEIDGVKSDAEHYQGRCRVLEDEVRSLTQKLVSKSKEHLEEAGFRAELEQLSDLPGIVKELEEQVARWRSRSADLDAESKRVARALDAANAEIRETNEDREQLERTISDLRAARAQVDRQLRDTRNQVEELTVKLESVTADRDSLVALSKASSEQLSQRSAASAAADVELDRCKIESQRAIANAEAAGRREAVLREQLQSAREGLSRTETQMMTVKDSLQATKVERDKLKETMASLEREVATLRSEECKLNEALQASEQNARDLAAQLDTERGERSKLTAHLEQFKSVFSKLDETRANLQDRVRELHTALQKEKANYAELDKKQKSIEEIARAATEKRGHLERALKDANEANERLLAQLDSKGKANFELESAVNKQELTYRELEQRLGAAKRQLYVQSQALESRDNDLQETLDEFAAAKRTIAHLEQMCKARSSELKAAAQDLANMTRENQAVNSSCQTLRVERDQLRVQLSEALARASRMDGLLESGKLEKADLLNVYRRSCDENARLKRLVQELSTSRAKVVGENQAQQADTSRLRQRLAESEEAVRKQQVDLQAYERQVADISRQMHAIKSRLDLTEEEKSFAERTATSARESTASMAHREQTLKWQLAQQQAEIDKLTLRISKLAADNEALHTQLLQERRRYQDLELVVTKARAAQAQASLAEKARAEELHSLRNTLLDREVEAERSFASTGGESHQSATSQSTRPLHLGHTSQQGKPRKGSHNVIFEDNEDMIEENSQDLSPTDRKTSWAVQGKQGIDKGTIAPPSTPTKSVDHQSELPTQTRSPPVSSITAPTNMSSTSGPRSEKDSSDPANTSPQKPHTNPTSQSRLRQETPKTPPPINRSHGATQSERTNPHTVGTPPSSAGSRQSKNEARARPSRTSFELESSADAHLGYHSASHNDAAVPSSPYSHASSSELDHMTSELEALISDQSDIIRRIQQDRRAFGQVTAEVRQDLETSRSRASILASQTRHDMMLDEAPSLEDIGAAKPGTPDSPFA